MSFCQNWLRSRVVVVSYSVPDDQKILFYLGQNRGVVLFEENGRFISHNL
jgi:hypothetical protein